MEKEFIPAYQAMELKFLGFNEDCFGYYHNVLGSDNINLFIEPTPKELYTRITIPEYENTLAPTYQQAFRFLREKLITKIITSERGDYIEGNFTLLPLIFLNKYEIRVIGESVSYYIDKTIGRNIPFYKEPLHRFTESAPTYEEAQLACLKRMIQIVKNK